MAVGDAMTRVYRKGVLEAEGFAVADVSEYLEQPDTIVWVDFCTPAKEQLHELEQELGLHELAVEDALGPHQRPKLDNYPTHLFLSCQAVRLNVENGSLDETEIDAFINERWLLTVRKNAGFSLDPVLERWDRSPNLAVNGVSFLLYGLLDTETSIVEQPGIRRVLRRSQRGHLLGTPPQPGRTATLVRDAPRHGPIPPSRGPHARSDQRPHATRARGRH
jgi:hypothetical protein